MIRRLAAPLVAILLAPPLYGRTAPVTLEFHIAPQPLSRALLTYSQQTGIVVVTSSDLLSGKTSAPLNGFYSAEIALNRIVDGTGLVVKSTPSGGLVLVKEETPLPAPPRDREKAFHPVTPTEVIVTGTRATSVKALESATPIQILDGAAVTRIGQTDLAQALAQSVPAFSTQAFGQDAANNTPSGGLRGLSPNDTLVLINGKRRHNTSSISIVAGPYQGGSAVDFSLIPVGAIDKIEVLSDGAAAQYGTDAIAGVINIILKKNAQCGSLTTTTGAYSKLDGKTADVTYNSGFKPTDKSFINLMIESKYHGYSNRGGIDPRISPYSSLAVAPGYPYLNRVFGDGTYRLAITSLNGAYDFNDVWQMYGFGIASVKTASSFENWRPPDKLPLLYPFGFSPHESIKERDTSITLGVRRHLKTWVIDASTTYGGDNQNIYNYGGGNVSLYADTGATPTVFYAGAFVSTQLVNMLDFNKTFNADSGESLNVAYGFEHRHETYTIRAGDFASTYKEGAQGFPGFSRTDAGRHARDNLAAYFDLSAQPVAALKLETALRFEHYSDFKDTLVGKFAIRYAFTPNLAVRSTLSSGFRAPTMPEAYYSATNVTPTTALVQLPPNSAAARLLGIENLKPEHSTNVSLGLVASPTPLITLTVDAYEISINNRIVGSGPIYGTGSPSGNNSVAVIKALAANGIVVDPSVTKTGISIFSNGLSTETKGVEFVVASPATYKFGKILWSLSGTFSLTRVTKVLQTPQQILPQVLFDQAAISNLQDSTPSYRWIGSAFWSKRKWSIGLKETLYGHSSNMIQSDEATENGIRQPGLWFRSTIHPHIITDLEIDYRLTDGVKLTVGANNLLNVFPEKLPPQLLQSYVKANDNLAVYQYASWSPFGINGGYYYSKIALIF